MLDRSHDSIEKCFNLTWEQLLSLFIEIDNFSEGYFEPEKREKNCVCSQGFFFNFTSKIVDVIRSANVAYYLVLVLFLIFKANI